MKSETIKYSKRNKIETDTKEETLKEELQALISEDIDEANLTAIKEKQNKLSAHEEIKLFDILSKKKDFIMLDDERPMKRFLSLESRKAGFSEITRLQIKNPTHNPNLPTNASNIDYYDVTENTQVRSELHQTFKTIYSEQPNLNLSQSALSDYIHSDGDTAPMKELNKRKISLELSRSMEGPLTTEEPTNTVMHTMKGDSSPGCDGFTVNHLRVFWNELKTITRDDLNSIFGNTLSISLRLAIFKLLRKGQKDPTLPGNYRPILLLSIFYKIASACIANRIKPAVLKIIGKEQKAYTSENNIGSCTSISST